jgi:hypothetical protein
MSVPLERELQLADIMAVDADNPDRRRQKLTGHERRDIWAIKHGLQVDLVLCDEPLYSQTNLWNVSRDMQVGA